MTPSNDGSRAAILTGIGLALFAPIFTVLLPSMGLDATDLTSPARLDAFVRHHGAAYSLPYIDGVLVHLAGIVVVVALHRHLDGRSPWVTIATIGGVGWMVLDIAQNGLGLYASHEVVQHADPAVSGPALVLIGQLTTGLRLAGHVLGGWWLLGISRVAARAGALPQPLSKLGLVCGALMSLNVLLPPTQLPLFALLPIWFVWAGLALPRFEEAGRGQSSSVLAA